MQTITVRKADVLSDADINSPTEQLIERRDLRKRSGYHLICLVSIPVLFAVCLLFQLGKPLDSSLSHPLLNAMISILINVSSSALLKAFSFLISLLGLSRSFTSSAS